MPKAINNYVIIYIFSLALFLCSCVENKATKNTVVPQVTPSFIKTPENTQTATAVAFPKVPEFTGAIAPSLPVEKFTNRVYKEGNSFIFEYSDSFTRIRYVYAPNTGSLHDLTLQVNNEAPFYPSNYGGPIFFIHGIDVPIWDTGGNYSFTHSEKTITGNSLEITWSMNSGDHAISYTYRLSIQGKTLVVEVFGNTPEISEFNLDRTENTPGAKIVQIPYMTNVNVLLYNKHFLTEFFDWTKSQSSGFEASSAKTSEQSLNFAQVVYYKPATNGSRNLLHETAYITVSDILKEVFPNIPNNPSPYRQLMANSVVVDIGEDDPFSMDVATVQKLHAIGANNLILIKHVWQKCGYDNCLPSTIPANSDLGGDQGLQALSNAAQIAGYLFALHQNYVDIYPNSDIFSPSLLALDSTNNNIQAWYNSSSQIQSYLLSPSKVLEIASLYSPEIKNRYETSSIYLDVHSAANPFDKVDFNSNTFGPSKMLTTINAYSQLFSYERVVNNGPVLGEGRMQIIYAGRIDSVEGQYQDYINDESNYPPIVDFDLLKIHPLMITYGMGDPARFFNTGLESFSSSDYDEYLATEIAYCHAGYIYRPAQVGGIEEANWEISTIAPIQKLCGLAKPEKILYNVDGQLVGVEEALIKNDAWQVNVTYDSGLQVYVNRNSKENWKIKPTSTQSWVDYNALVAGKQKYYIGKETLSEYMLPPNGWLVIMP